MQYVLSTSLDRGEVSLEGFKFDYWDSDYSLTPVSVNPAFWIIGFSQPQLLWKQEQASDYPQSHKNILKTNLFMFIGHITSYFWFGNLQFWKKV